MKKCINFILLVSICVGLFPISKDFVLHAQSVADVELVTSTEDSGTYLDESSFEQNIILEKQSSPFYISGQLTIPRGVTVRVKSGVKLIFESGSIKVLGSMLFEGAEGDDIEIEQDALSKGFILIGGSLSAKYINAHGGANLIDAYASSSILISNFNFNNIGGPNTAGAVFSVWQESLMSLKDGVILNIRSGQAMTVFLGGTILFDDVNMSGLGSRTSISIFNNLVRDGIKIRSIVEISSSTLSKSHDGVEVFNDAYLSVKNSAIEEFENAGLIVFSKGEVEVTESAIRKNKRGIESYDSVVSVEQSIFEENSEYAVIHTGGSFEGKDNWWGDSSGPYSLDKNPTGTGDTFLGSGNISPWLTEKKKVECCSNVLFVPGVQGSRMYRKNIFNKEIQLWEPGSNSDVTKLLLDENGIPKDKTLYTRDIIDKTNISLGLFDVGVYNTFIHAMNGLDMNFSIRDWTYFPYDWRSSPNVVTVSGSRIGTSDSDSVDVQFLTMESEIDRLSKTSKTKKVTIIGHSYGGIVTKRFLSYLSAKGKIGLIDKVIFVAVPEEGSPSALFALLHGDNQEIGGGYILNKNTARKLAVNMPSLYALLPNYNSQLIKGITPNVTTVADMYKFIFKDVERPFTKDMNDIELPIVGNKIVSDSIRSESSLYKQQEDPDFKNIQFFNIVGTGINTPSSITYTKGKCPISVYIPVLPAPDYCGLKHTQSYTKLGDGNVPLGNLDLRWGDKYIFDMSNYNSAETKNFSHLNIISADPVISTIMQILLDNIGFYQLPKYISHYGGSRINLPNQTYQSISKPTYVLSSSEDLNIRIKDSAGNVAGANLDYLKDLQSSGTNSSNANSLNTNPTEFIPTQNTSPNSSYGSVGNSTVVISEYIPIEVHANGGSSIQNNIQNNPVTYTDISLVKIEPEHSSSSSNIIFEFKDIPVTENTNIEIKINQASSSDSTSTEATLTLTDTINGTSGNTQTYTYSGGGSFVGSSYINSSTGAIGGFADIGYVISGIRESLIRSSLRKNFKNRYLLKLETIEKYNKSTNEKIRSLARQLSKDTILSLSAIIKDLGRYRPLYYNGGMQRGEAVFLYSQFIRLGRAYGDF